MVKTTDKTTEAETPAPPPIKGAFNRYDSPFLQLVAPIIATRYLWLAIEEINPLNFLGKTHPRERVDFKPAKKLSTLRYMSHNFAAFGMGATFLGIIGLYSKNTLHDVKSLYAEAVGYELNKKPDDVSLSDIFMKSENAALKVTRGAYVRRTLARMATAATFFLPWQKFRDFKEVTPKYDANANAGVGAIGVYLLGESFLRKKSFFDAEQNMVSWGIHHNNANPNQTITPADIKSLLFLQRRHLNKSYAWPVAASREGKEQLALATRIASLMNQTFHNEPNSENAHFTIGKFNFLLGFGLLDQFPENLAFVELANKSADMNDVKQAAAAIKSGQRAEEVFASFGINTIQPDHELISAPQAAPHETKLTNVLKPGQGKAIVHKSLKDFAEQATGPRATGL